MKFSLTLEQAQSLHKQYFTELFQTIYFQRSGYFDFPPFSWVYGIGDFGGWHGILSTDGNRVVVSSLKSFDHTKINETYELRSDEITSITIGTFKTKMQLRRSIGGVTSTPLEIITAMFLMVIGIGIVQLIRRRKRFHIRVHKEFGSIEGVKSLLKI